MTILDVKWEPMITLTTRELVDYTQQYILQHYPNWKKSQYGVGVRWARNQEYIWTFKTKDPHYLKLIEDIGLKSRHNSYNQMHHNMKTLFNATVVSMDINREFVVIQGPLNRFSLQSSKVPQSL